MKQIFDITPTGGTLMRAILIIKTYSGSKERKILLEFDKYRKWWSNPAVATRKGRNTKVFSYSTNHPIS